MKRVYSIILIALLAAGSFVPAVPTLAASKAKHNGACVGFAGVMAGKYRYAGIKCYLDSSPGNWVIRSSVKERDDPKAYKKLVRIPKHPKRCTLVKGKTKRFGGVNKTFYKIKNC